MLITQLAFRENPKGISVTAITWCQHHILIEGCGVSIGEGQEVVHSSVQDRYQLFHCSFDGLELTLAVRQLSDHRTQRCSLQAQACHSDIVTILIEVQGVPSIVFLNIATVKYPRGYRLCDKAVRHWGKIVSSCTPILRVSPSKQVTKIARSLGCIEQLQNKQTPWP